MQNSTPLKIVLLAPGYCYIKIISFTFAFCLLFPPPPSKQSAKKTWEKREDGEERRSKFGGNYNGGFDKIGGGVLRTLC